ncbi:MULTISPECIES: hypothetical protein [Sediminibacillus]|uniref:Uncharacterized protein n=2 Tax=Sediminibacillus TaxID=482460 RepID=A0A1G9TVR3_9BACI|nr:MULTISPECIES: hypothetical protein [Sediminibacillus]QTN00920.1 hypothetical protein ERJ70_17480 [Sediminibacillus dalangtanensis]SDM51504.1 hypothetical protein SAMN05216244_2743 [Sediminibacillus halophilus]
MIDYTVFVSNIEQELKRELCNEELEFVLWMYERYIEDQQQMNFVI